MGSAREEGGTAAGGRGRGGESWGLTGGAWLARDSKIKKRRGAARPGARQKERRGQRLHVRGSRLQLLPIRLYGSGGAAYSRGLESLAAAAEESLAAAAAAADAETRVSAVKLVLLDAC